MTTDPAIVRAVENLSMIGAKPVDILMTKLIFAPSASQIGRFRPVHAGFVIPFA
jgi:hypothetical protein